MELRSSRVIAGGVRKGGSVAAGSTAKVPHLNSAVANVKDPVENEQSRMLKSELARKRQKQPRPCREKAFRPADYVKLVDKEFDKPNTTERNSIKLQLIPSPPGKGSLCPRCGHAREFYNKCGRCDSVIIDGKLVNIPDRAQQNDVTMITQVGINPQVSASTTASAQAWNLPFVLNAKSMACPVGVGILCARCGYLNWFYSCIMCGHKMIDGKLVAYDGADRATQLQSMVALSLSSVKDSAGAMPGAEASEPELEKSCQENSFGVVDCSIERVELVSLTGDGHRGEEDGVRQQDTMDNREVRRWKRMGFRRRPQSFTCWMLHIGSYVTNPTKQLLFSDEGILLEVHRMLTDGRGSQQLVDVAIYKDQILRIDVNFGAPYPAIFLWLAPASVNLIRAQLNMEPLFNPATAEYWEKWLILLPQQPLDEHKQHSIKVAFGMMNVFHEISPIEADYMLRLASAMLNLR